MMADEELQDDGVGAPELDGLVYESDTKADADLGDPDDSFVYGDEPEDTEETAPPPKAEPPAPAPAAHEFDKDRQRDQIARANAEKQRDQVLMEYGKLQARLERLESDKKDAEDSGQEGPIEDYDAEIKKLRDKSKTLESKLAEATTALDGVKQVFENQAKMQRLSAENAESERVLVSLSKKYGETLAEPALKMALQEAMNRGYRCDAKDPMSFPPAKETNDLMRVAFLELAYKAKEAQVPKPVKPGTRHIDGRNSATPRHVLTRGTPEEVEAAMRRAGRFKY